MHFGGAGGFACQSWVSPIFSAASVDRAVCQANAQCEEASIWGDARATLDAHCHVSVKLTN